MITVPRRQLLALSTGCALAVANLYYAQPLLAAIARTFHTQEGSAGLVVTATQIGYATGPLLLVPLGDLPERRRLVVGVLLATGTALVAAALAPTRGWRRQLARFPQLGFMDAEVAARLQRRAPDRGQAALRSRRGVLVDLRAAERERRPRPVTRGRPAR